MSVMQKVKKHMRANDIPLPDNFKVWFEDRLCVRMNLGYPYCGQHVEEKPRNPIHLSLSLVARFVATILEFTKSGMQMVDQKEADRRADVCGACLLNTSIGGCTGCYTIVKPLKAMLGSRKTREDLKYCGACGCSLALKVWVPNDVLDKAERGRRPAYAANCWRQQVPGTTSDENG